MERMHGESRALVASPGQMQFEGTTEATNELILELSRVWNRSAVSTLIAVGEVLIRRCYEGDVEKWRSRGANAWLRQLETHERLPFGRKTIYQAVHFYDLSLRLTDRQCLSDLGVGHVRAVLGLKAEDQEHLLSEARAQSWPIARLTQEVSNKRHVGRKSGRPPMPHHMRFEKQIRQHVEALEALVRNPMLLEVAAPERVTALMTAVSAMRSQVAMWRPVTTGDRNSRS